MSKRPSPRRTVTVVTDAAELETTRTVTMTAGEATITVNLDGNVPKVVVQ